MASVVPHQIEVVRGQRDTAQATSRHLAPGLMVSWRPVLLLTRCSSTPISTFVCCRIQPLPYVNGSDTFLDENRAVLGFSSQSAI